MAQESGPMVPINLLVRTAQHFEELAKFTSTTTRRLVSVHKDWVTEIQKLPLSDAERTREMARMNEWILNLAESIAAKTELLAHNHAKALQISLTLLGKEQPR